MNRKFREGSLALDFAEKDRADNVVYEMQKMFAFLQESRRRSYDPRSFCHAYKDSGGKSVNVSVQMDVDEFYNQLCDKFELIMHNTPQRHLMKSFWDGTIANQLI